MGKNRFLGNDNIPGKQCLIVSVKSNTLVNSFRQPATGLLELGRNIVRKKPVHYWELSHVFHQSSLVKGFASYVQYCDCREENLCVAMYSINRPWWKGSCLWALSCISGNPHIVAYFIVVYFRNRSWWKGWPVLCNTVSSRKLMVEVTLGTWTPFNGSMVEAAHPLIHSEWRDPISGAWCNMFLRGEWKLEWNCNNPDTIFGKYLKLKPLITCITGILKLFEDNQPQKGTLTSTDNLQVH